jgi:hypothetical protein
MSDQREQQRPLTTTDAGSPAPSDDSSLTVGAGGPNLLQDTYLIEKLAHFVRERIPDRVYLVLRAIASGWGGTAESVMFHQGVAAFELPQVGRDLHASHSFHGADLPGQQVVEVPDITASDRREEVRRTGCGADELDFRELTEGVPGSF